MKSLLRTTTAAVALLVAAGTAQAGIVHDTPAEFEAINVNQGTNWDTTAVAANRSNINSIFDNNGSTFFSLGLGGSLSLTIKPTWDYIGSGSLIEITFPGSDSHEEAVQVFLGTIANPFMNSIGFLLNGDANHHLFGTFTPGVIDTSAVADLSATTYPGSEGGAYVISNIVGQFNTISFRDASGISMAGKGQNPFWLRGSYDGFDIGELEVTSVPEPATMALLGMGLVGIGAAARRRRSAGV